MKRAAVIAVLSASAIGLAVALDHVHRSPVETSPIGRSSRISPSLSTSRTSLSPPLAGQPTANFSEIVNRPLFWPSRRPIAPVPAPAPRSEVVTPASEPVPSGLRLAGIISDDNVRRRALLVWPSQPTGQWLAEGAELAGWKLVKIDWFGVQVRTGSRIERLELH